MIKCVYYNDARTACTLMIDDLMRIAVTKDGTVNPWNDWGFCLDGKNSLWRYFENNFLHDYPHIKGTIFFPTNYQALSYKSGYIIKNKEIDSEFKSFIKKSEPFFELAFHGTTHGKFINEDNPEFKNNFQQEFEYINPGDIARLAQEIKKVEDFFEIKFQGGKYCGYLKNRHADKIIEKLGFKWWASSAEMIDRKHPRNVHTYFGEHTPVLDFPTNVSGSMFNKTLKATQAKNKLLSILKAPFRQYKKEQYLQYLYENGYIISIQEHFQNQRTDGKRQNPNVYDDIDSLNQIFSLLRGADVWYATCSEIAHYKESYDNTEILNKGNDEFEVKYRGRWKKPLLSIRTNMPKLLELGSGITLQGLYKNQAWIFNNITEGKYRKI